MGVEIHSCIGSVVAVGVAVVGDEGILLACLGRAGFWKWASFCYRIQMPGVLLFQFLDFAVALTIIISKGVDRSDEIPSNEEYEKNFEEQ